MKMKEAVVYAFAYSIYEYKSFDRYIWIGKSADCISAKKYEHRQTYASFVCLITNSIFLIHSSLYLKLFPLFPSQSDRFKPYKVVSI